MKLALTADWHFRGKDLAAAIAQLQALIAECHARGVRLVCVAGDIFDRQNIGDNLLSTGAIAGPLIQALKKSGLEWVLIPGNHDQSSAAAVDALTVFDGMSNVTVAHERMVVRHHYAPEISILCVPWDWSGTTTAEAATTKLLESAAYNPYCADQKLLLLAHWQIVGMKMAQFKVCESSTSWFVTREFLEGLTVHHRACGDFHGRQPGYVGALRQLNHGEEGNPAGFEIWDTETNAVEWVELNAAPRYRTLNITAGETVAEAEGYITKVNVSGRPTGEQIQALEARGFQVDEIVEAPTRTQRVAAIPEGIGDRPHDVIDLWAGQQDGFDAEELAALHLEFDLLEAGK